MSAIELKIGEFKPEYIGKMQLHLTALDKNVKLPDEYPSIGIIICKSKNRMRVDYTLGGTNVPIGVATYSYYESLSKDMRSLLPSLEEIANIVLGLGGNLFEFGEFRIDGRVIRNVPPLYRLAEYRRNTTMIYSYRWW